ncbi:MAG: alanyl-tRNA editing protein [Roseobacter sp.]|jgi:misacylated tRNA(Ala) deacylase|nr:alanyl-tRNA editing protein [Roseobacter sp.]
MTELLFLDDAYRKTASACVLAQTETGGLALDRSIFYPTGGGQPGDSGDLVWDGGTCAIATTIKGAGGHIICQPAIGQTAPPVGITVEMRLDWARRFGHMRVHSALHLLSVALPYGVTGGSISADKGRIDFNMENPPEDKEALAASLNAMIATDARVSEEWITEAELDAQPELVKTLTVQPPRGTGRIRLIRIADDQRTIDLQPCGGTHVWRLSEIGAVRVGKVEKKGRMNRRVYLHLLD